MPCHKPGQACDSPKPHALRAISDSCKQANGEKETAVACLRTQSTEGSKQEAAEYVPESSSLATFQPEPAAGLTTAH